MNVNKRLNVNYRAGGRVNIIDLLQELEDKYRANLSATCEAYDNYDAVLEETDNDKNIFIAELGVLHATGYLNEDEFDAMVQIVGGIRLNILENLEKLEKEGVENGSEETEQ